MSRPTGRPRRGRSPILEFDPSPTAVIEPRMVVDRGDVADHCVVCFFQDVLGAVLASRPVRIASESRWEDGDWRVYEMDHEGQRLAFFHPGVGAPVAAGKLEEVIALGCTKFIAAGGCGVLESSLAVGHVILPDSAVRDEGTSYHYLPPGREGAVPSPAALVARETVLTRREVPFVRGRTWTTDAPYRETPGTVARRRKEGCLAVEMEAAAFFAVAAFRGVTFGQLFYAGDDVGSEAWDHRAWDERKGVREQLFWLAAEACLSLG